MPTTSPRLLILLAPFSAPPRLPRSWTEPSLSHNTACAAVLLLTANGGRPVVEHKPELPTVWPRSLIGPVILRRWRYLDVRGGTWLRPFRHDGCRCRRSAGCLRRERKRCGAQYQRQQGRRAGESDCEANGTNAHSGGHRLGL